MVVSLMISSSAHHDRPSSPETKNIIDDHDGMLRFIRASLFLADSLSGWSDTTYHIDLVEIALFFDLPFELDARSLRDGVWDGISDRRGFGLLRWTADSVGFIWSFSRLLGLLGGEAVDTAL